MNDLTNPRDIIRELFDDDHWVKDEFANHIAEELTELSVALAACFRLMPAKKKNQPVTDRYWEKLDDGDERTQGHL